MSFIEFGSERPEGKHRSGCGKCHRNVSIGMDTNSGWPAEKQYGILPMDFIEQNQKNEEGARIRNVPKPVLSRILRYIRLLRDADQEVPKMLPSAQRQ